MLKDQAIKQTYLLYGEEEYLKNKWLKELQDATVSEDDLMNYSLFEGKDIDVTKVMDVGETMPFFATHKLIIVKESGFFKTGKKEETQKLAKWIENIPDYVVIVFIEKEIDKRNGLYKAINSKKGALAFDCPEESDLMRLLTGVCQERGMQISAATLRYFLQNMPPSIHYMLGELEKLSAYCSNEEVTKGAIQAVCVFSLEQRVFELLKEMNKKNTTEALAIYNRMIESKESPIGVLVLIARQYRILLQVKYLIKTRTPAKEIAKLVGIPPFIATETAKQSEQFTFKQLETILAHCLESDVAIKTGKMEPVKCIEMLILQCIYTL